MRLETAGADTYVAGAGEAVTLAHGSPVVLRIEMSEPDADQLLARICR